MNYITARDQRRGGRGTIEIRKRRMRPTLMALEDRKLLSTFTVTSTLDDGSDGTLRWAVTQANLGGDNTISFDSTVFGTPKTISLGGTQLELSDTTGTETITGPAAGVTVDGGGLSRVLQADGGVTASISGLTISGGKDDNFASGGGVLSLGAVALTDCTVSGNSFHGVTIQGGTATLTGCTVSGNSAGRNGGGLFDAGVMATLTDCTVSGNSASSGGALLNDRVSKTTLVNCTVSGNSARSSGGGLDNLSGTVTFGNSIVAVNTAGTSGPDAFGAVASRGNNLVGKTDGSSGWVGSDLTGTIASPLDPLMAPLGAYGGPTKTMPLLPGSAAIDAGSNALIPAGVTTDQRGFARIVNTVVDIGAFESGGFTIAATSGSGQSAGVLTAFSAPLVATVTANNPGEPVAGGLVTFTPPAGGASANLSGSPATIGAAGTASVTATANGIVGGYAVSATASGITTPASFSLTNVALIIALDPSAAGALSLSGNAIINTPGIVYVDSSSSSALSAGGRARVTAGAIDVHGGVQRTGQASLSPAPVTGAPALAVASLPLPSTTGMTNDGSFSLGGSSSATIQPGIYSSMSISQNAQLTMAGGIYIIEGGGFSVADQASVTGSGVMIFNAGSNYPGAGGTYGAITLGGTSTYNLSPATSGPYAGIVFFQPVDNTQVMTVTANASGITGTIYAPGAPLSESGHGVLDASLIVDTLTISSNGVVNGPATLSSTIVAVRPASEGRSPAGSGSTNLAGTGGSGAPIVVIDGNIIAADTNEAAAVFDQTKPPQSGVTIPIKIKVIDAQGNKVSSSSLPAASMSAVGTDGNLVPQTAPGSPQSGTLFLTAAIVRTRGMAGQAIR